MGRTPLFRRLLETMRIAASPAASSEAVDAAAEGISRRQILKIGGVAAAAVAGCAAPATGDEAPIGRTRARLPKVNADIGIVGAGIAGVACAYELARSGVAATIHEANDRVGGRIYSMGGVFPQTVDWMGQSIERGGELIDTPHKTMQGYAQELGLALEDMTKPKRDTFYYFDGQLIPESTMVDEYRALVDAMQDDLRQIGEPTASSYTDFEKQVDNLSLAQWLDLKGAGHNIKKLLSVAYCIEYGVEADALGVFAFLLFAKASKQSKIRLWGNFSDERYHVVGGNQQIPVGLSKRLKGPINFGRKLLAARKLSDGRIELTFDASGTTITVKHDAVVFAIPFHLLKNVQLDASLGLPDWKKYAIQNVIYGNNAKLMVGFVGEPWVDLGSSGASYADLPYLQNTWETDGIRATADHAVLTDYTGGNLSLSISPKTAQKDCGDFLSNLDLVYPGSKARARRDASGKYVCHLEHWPSNPLTQGAYTANQPGYFTSIAGYEPIPVGNLYFAGETTDSFYEWQGFMEGGALSGVRVAGEIGKDFG